MDIRPVSFRDDRLFLLDQTGLPNRVEEIEITNREELFEAISVLKVRGAPAIGVAAGYGLYIMAKNITQNVTEEDSEGQQGSSFVRALKEDAEYINSSRPTAVNLSWALKRCLRAVEKVVAEDCEVDEIMAVLRNEAICIDQENTEACKSMGEYGLKLFKPGMGILTHCNAGALATVDYGTCLSPIYLGQERGYGFKVFSDETRPLLQGARLTSWELAQAGVDVTLICDNMASQVMKNGWIDAVVVGCDRMAANGDAANKIGTSGVAILAKEYGIPVYFFVPSSTIDMGTENGESIRIELRDGEEIKKMWYREPMAPEGVGTYNPSFDVTPAKYISAVITEKGIVRPPYKENLRKLMPDEF